ncbi:MAG: helix-turn-helix transcriptional regulator [Pseudonocardiaceae bacterium]
MTVTAHSTALGDADVARVAALIGDRARARVLMALVDGRALPASVLAAEAGVAASTISEHLAQLVDGQLLTAERSGRHRYFRLADASVARALEAIAEIAPPEPISSLRQGTRAQALRRARTCYQHLAGRLGVTVMAALIDSGVLLGGDGLHHLHTAGRDRLAAAGTDTTYQLTPAGHRQLTAFGLDVCAVLRHRCPIRYCVDWSEQRHHLAGALGNALTSRLFDLDWIRRSKRPRAVTLTDAGRHGLHSTFGVPENWESAIP